MTPPRFSLRALQIDTAVLAGFCYWRDLPRQNAKRFAALIQAGDYEAAEAMIARESEVIPKLPPPALRWRVSIAAPSFGDWLKGRRLLIVSSDARNNSLLSYMEATPTDIRPAGQWYVAATTRR